MLVSLVVSVWPIATLYRDSHVQFEQNGLKREN